MTFKEKIKEIKERYSLFRFCVACVIVNTGTFLIFVLMHQTHGFVEVAIWFPVAWFMVFVLMIFFTEFLNLGGQEEDER